ncbi:LysR family transcriptional regulator [Streptomyces sp. BH055]|uniref:LysR family transcriptional regulator n=1 Tax=Streptomyces sp. BH055 TaxID=3401173 RepID=UPI003BB494F0
MELRDIEIFLTLADELHFGHTAERLHISPPRVSQAIARQERRLGGELFDRSNRRRIRLTPLGQQLRDDLLPAHQRIQQAIDRAATAAQTGASTLRAGYSGPWCADLLMRAADAFRDRHPSWAMQIQESQLNDPYGPLHRDELDLQLVEFPVQEPGITTGPVLFREPRSLIVPADHPLARRTSASLEDLADVPLIALAHELPQHVADLHYPRRTPMGRTIPRGPAYTFWHDVPVLVAAGLGVSIAASRAARYHDRPGIAFVPLRDAPTLDYGLLWPAGKQAPLLPDFVALLRELADPAGVGSQPATPLGT